MSKQERINFALDLEPSDNELAFMAVQPSKDEEYVDSFFDYSGINVDNLPF